MKLSENNRVYITLLKRALRWPLPAIPSSLAAGSIAAPLLPAGQTEQVRRSDNRSLRPPVPGSGICFILKLCPERSPDTLSGQAHDFGMAARPVFPVPLFTTTLKRRIAGAGRESLTIKLTMACQAICLSIPAQCPDPVFTEEAVPDAPYTIRGLKGVHATGILRTPIITTKKQFKI